MKGKSGLSWVLVLVVIVMVGITGFVISDSMKPKAPTDSPVSSGSLKSIDKVKTLTGEGILSREVTETQKKARAIDLKATDELTGEEVEGFGEVTTSASPTTTCENMYQDPFNGTTLKTANWAPSYGFTKVQGDKLVQTYKTTKTQAADPAGNKYINYEMTVYKKDALNTEFTTEIDLTSLITTGSTNYMHEGGLAIELGNLGYRIGINDLKLNGTTDPWLQVLRHDYNTGETSLRAVVVLDTVKAVTLQVRQEGTRYLNFNVNVGAGMNNWLEVDFGAGSLTNIPMTIYSYSHSSGSNKTTTATNKFDNFTFSCGTQNRDYWYKTTGVSKTPISSVEFNGRQYQFMADSLDRINSRSSGDTIFDGSDARENWAYDLTAGGPGGSSTKQIYPVVHGGKLVLTMVSKAGYIYTKKLLTAGSATVKPTWEPTWYRNTADTVKPPVAVSAVSFNGNMYQFLTSAGKKHYFRKSADGVFDTQAEYQFTAFSGTSVLNNTQFTLAVDKLGAKLFVVAAGDSGKHYIQSTTDGVFDGSAPSEKFVEMPTSILFAQTPTIRAYKGKLWEAGRGSLYNNVYTRNSADGVTWTPWVSYGGTATGQIELGAAPANDKLFLTMINAAGSPYNRRYFDEEYINI